MKHSKSVIWSIIFPMQGKKSTKLTSGMFLQLKKLLIETLIEEIKPVVMGDKGGWVWMSRKTFDWRCFWDIWTIKILMQRTKTTVFLLYKCYVLDEFLVEAFELIVTEEYKFEYWSKEKNSTFFGNSVLSRHWCKQHKSTIFTTQKSLHPENFDADPDGANYAVCERWVWISGKIRTFSLEFLDS